MIPHMLICIWLNYVNYCSSYWRHFTCTVLGCVLLLLLLLACSILLVALVWLYILYILYMRCNVCVIVMDE